ncbi:MAG: 5-(carboxyamino)imidazole ribonucleotide mutase [Candidatus Latescibacterota bacterium]|nr:MAG: 5-(carboxyamino)imidazole ribonucleotide mutase [Candidatus Latescibacterota bacterium]RKY74958.1 MAG: 5-(carboxyamino)imidazole ribonucleotide mutase [Candidatus Latescibacterota bacterium]
MKPKVAVVMGSESDREVMKKAVEQLEALGISCETFVASAHRTPERAVGIAQEAEERGFKVIIAGAGLSAALPGVLAAHTTLPVVGVPIASGPLGGIDALLSMVQMPTGVPVATVGINNAKNAAILAAEILALSDEGVRKALERMRGGWRG